jgi:hypothetical protein
MPVPVVITHPAGKGLTAHDATVNAALPTEGPFERMKRLAAEAAQKIAQEGPSGTAAAPAVPAQPIAAAPQPQAPAPAGAGVDVRNLNFAYPGLGQCWLICPFSRLHAARTSLWQHQVTPTVRLRPQTAGPCQGYLR